MNALLYSICTRRRCRRRIRFHFHRYLPEKPFSLTKLELFDEQFQGCYTGGRELPASCGSDRGFAEDLPLAKATAKQYFSECAVRSMQSSLPSNMRQSQSVQTPGPCWARTTHIVNLLALLITRVQCIHTRYRCQGHWHTKHEHQTPSCF
jgi:hypothetical protein